MIEVGKTYRHNKSKKLYRVLNIAKHSETLEDMVVYEALYENNLAKIWARPVDNFIEQVMIDGIKRPRFKKID